MTFKKQLIAFSEADYNKAVADAQEKIKRLYNALNWTAKYILVEHIKLNEFMDNPMDEFMRVFAEKWSVKYPDIKPSKLAMLLDVPLEELSALKERIMAIKQPVKVSKGQYVANVSKDTWSVRRRTWVRRTRILRSRCMGLERAVLCLWRCQERAWLTSCSRVSGSLRIQPVVILGFWSVLWVTSLR